MQTTTPVYELLDKLPIKHQVLLRYSTQSAQTARPAHAKAAAICIDEGAETSETRQLSSTQRDWRELCLHAEKRSRGHRGVERRAPGNHA